MTTISTIKIRSVACPNCKLLSEFSTANAFRPFCSERCKLIDLGLWASEQYAIPEAVTLDAIATELDGDFPHQ